MSDEKKEAQEIQKSEESGKPKETEKKSGPHPADTPLEPKLVKSEKPEKPKSEKEELKELAERIEAGNAEFKSLIEKNEKVLEEARVSGRGFILPNKDPPKPTDQEYWNKLKRGELTPDYNAH